MHLYNLESEMIYVWHSTLFSFWLPLEVLSWWPLHHCLQTKHFKWSSVTAVKWFLSGMQAMELSMQTLHYSSLLAGSESNLFCLENWCCFRTWTSPEVSGSQGHCLRTERQQERRKFLIYWSLRKHALNVSRLLSLFLVGRDGVPWCPLCSY